MMIYGSARRVWQYNDSAFSASETKHENVLLLKQRKVCFAFKT
jgi:hypothetical protein